VVWAAAIGGGLRHRFVAATSCRASRSSSASRSPITPPTPLLSGKSSAAQWLVCADQWGHTHNRSGTGRARTDALRVVQVGLWGRHPATVSVHTKSALGEGTLAAHAEPSYTRPTTH
jgi:hypothetical protein